MVKVILGKCDGGLESVSNLSSVPSTAIIPMISSKVFDVIWQEIDVVF